VVVAFAAVVPSSSSSSCSSPYEDDRSKSDVTSNNNNDNNIVLVKIGGSSITNKGKYESLDEKSLSWFAKSIAKSVSDQYSFGKMTTTTSNNDSDGHNQQCSSSSSRKFGFVIVHGAGSFGHFSAKEYGLKGQGRAPPPSSSFDERTNNITHLEELTRQRQRKREGLVKTRLSVQKLNQIMIAELVKYGINAVGISPCFGIPGLETHAHLQPRPCEYLQSTIYHTIQAGYVPVLHGDACLYGDNDTGILSGDTLMEILGVQSWVQSAVFITDVDGVFDKDPREDPNAQLLENIAVDISTGEIVTSLEASESSHDHDVTGGLRVSLYNVLIIPSNFPNTA
jgi:isopentenyl phosphate kinase